jgi:hypothetical protein
MGVLMTGPCEECSRKTWMLIGMYEKNGGECVGCKERRAWREAQPKLVWWEELTPTGVFAALVACVLAMGWILATGVLIANPVRRF